MRILLGLCLVSVVALPQQGVPVGIFTGSADVGAPPLQGAATFDPATKRYTLTGTGTDIWARADQFRYAWRDFSGNFAVQASATFVTDGNPHRKASIMLRKTIDAGSPFVHLAIHGDGLPAVQFRSAQGDTTNTLDFPVEGPGTFTLRLVREGSTITTFLAKQGGPMRELGRTQNQLGSPVLVGLAVASHSQEALTTVVFSDVSVDPLPPPRGGR